MGKGSRNRALRWVIRQETKGQSSEVDKSIARGIRQQEKGRGQQTTMKYIGNKMRRIPIAPKPCPTCYTPMKLVGKDQYECDKHGPPVKR